MKNIERLGALIISAEPPSIKQSFADEDEDKSEILVELDKLERLMDEDKLDRLAKLIV